MVLAVPVSSLGQTPSAILRTQGGVWVNGYEARDSSAIFAGDLLETKPGFSASLTLDGSTVLIQQESVGKFQGDMLVLDHGAVSVGTSKGFKVRVKCITVVPVLNEWTQYDVTDVNGNVQVAAHKSDVNVEQSMVERKAAGATPPPPSVSAPPSAPPQESRGATVHENEQKNFRESEMCGAPAPVEGTTSLNPKWIAIGAGAATGLLVCIFVCGGHNGGKPSMSQSAP
ncbi:MAG TPA: hypothetical protein VFE61_14070 [Candidatus Sulfotelmatobacter sp.]|jgi:hypothetical protein|nr:hypothetical protein [Candidatus Sulfotelmatobacter sp.]